MSPIEEKLYAALMQSVPADYTLRDLVGDADTGSGDEYACLDGQVPLLSYVADFVLTANGGDRLVVECDGHDFHNVTKQQAAYDRARDRELLAVGILTIRFTGSEIHHSPERCAREVWSIFARVVADGYAAMNGWQAGFAAGHRRGASGEPV